MKFWATRLAGRFLAASRNRAVRAWIVVDRGAIAAIVADRGGDRGGFGDRGPRPGGFGGRSRSAPAGFAGADASGAADGSARQPLPTADPADPAPIMPPLATRNQLGSSEDRVRSEARKATRANE